MPYTTFDNSSLRIYKYQLYLAVKNLFTRRVSIAYGKVFFLKSNISKKYQRLFLSNIDKTKSKVDDKCNL